jgi:hypothetical protein
VWSDFVQHAEQLHFLRLAIWGALSTLAGTMLLVVAHARGNGTALIRRFGAVCGLCGAIELLIALVLYRDVPLRDLSAATRLDRLAWLQLGLFIGLAGIGVAGALVSFAVRPPAEASKERTLAVIGIGAAIALHGIALATLELSLIASISR